MPRRYPKTAFVRVATRPQATIKALLAGVDALNNLENPADADLLLELARGLDESWRARDTIQRIQRLHRTDGLTCLECRCHWPCPTYKRTQTGL